jgi:predicted nucleotidyltransferase
MKEEDEVIAVYIFGSTFKKYKFKEDLDIAILVKDTALKEGITKLQNKFYTKLRYSLKRQDIDIVILNTASLLLKYQVIKEGKLVYEKDIEERIDFEVKTMLLYFDFLPIRELFWQDLLERVKNGRFAKSSY